MRVVDGSAGPSLVSIEKVANTYLQQGSADKMAEGAVRTCLHFEGQDCDCLDNCKGHEGPAPVRVGSVHAGRLAPVRLIDWVSLSLVISTDGLI